MVVALNVFAGDSTAAVEALGSELVSRGVPFAANDGFARGAKGALELGRVVAAVAEGTDASPPVARFLYPPEMPPEEKARAIARTVYGAHDVVFTPRALDDLARFRPLGGDRLPICLAKTHLSLSDDPHRTGRPCDFEVTVREVRLCAGSGILVALAGDITTMPGLPKEPAARHMRLRPA